MQEQNEQKSAKLFGRICKMELVWMGLCLVIMMAVAGVALYSYKDLPMSTRGESHTKFPWYGEGIVIEDVEVHWQNSAASKSGSDFLATHVGYYPVIKIRLAENCSGTGTLAVMVTDGDLNTQNKPMRLSYRDGEFVTLTRRSGYDLDEASGKEATLRIPCGMGKEASDNKDFLYHISTRDRKLWRVYISNRPMGNYDEYTEMGYTTIPASGDDL